MTNSKNFVNYVHLNTVKTDDRFDDWLFTVQITSNLILIPQSPRSCDTGNRIYIVSAKRIEIFHS